MDASGGEAAAYLFPQQGREVEADQIVERTSCLLGVDQVHGEIARVGDSLLNGLLGNLVEHHALNGFILEQPAVFQ